MARIWSLTSASSSILVWRCSKIRGSIIPELEAMVVGRGSRCLGSKGQSWSYHRTSISGPDLQRWPYLHFTESRKLHNQVSLQVQMVFDIEIMLPVPSLPLLCLPYSRLGRMPASAQALRRHWAPLARPRRLFGGISHVRPFGLISRTLDDSSSHFRQARICNEKIFRVNWRQCNTSDTVVEDMSKPRGPQPGEKNKYNQCDSRRNLSEIKLKRTDTTLDLSQ